jgi:hypothetical protein
MCEMGRPLFAFREQIICESYVRANKDIVPDPQTVPKLDATLYRYAIAQDNVILDEDMIADVAVFADDSAG